MFTSFKLPKPGGGSVGGGIGPGGANLTIGPGGPEGRPIMTSPGPVSPVTSQSGFGSRLFPIGLGNLPPTTPGSNNTLHSSPPKINAPLGGLPALADQLLMQQAIQLKDKDDLEAESNNNRLVSPSRSPVPASPPPTKIRPGGPVDAGDSSGSEGTPLKNQQGLIKAKGTYYPLTAFPTSMPQGPVMRSESPPHVEPASSGE